MNKIILVGRLCDDPELRFVGENNVPVTKFTLAVNRNYKNDEGNYDVDFINCELWDKSAEIFCKYMSKGRVVGIDGKLKTENYTSSTGENKYSIIVRVNSFDFIPYTKRKDSNSENTFNSNAIFNDEELFEGEIPESEVPF